MLPLSQTSHTITDACTHRLFATHLDSRASWAFPPATMLSAHHAQRERGLYSGFLAVPAAQEPFSTEPGLA
eukprot:4486195-Pleurochrysis_carterae.AAC.5